MLLSLLLGEVSERALRRIHTYIRADVYTYIHTYIQTNEIARERVGELVAMAVLAYLCGVLVALVVGLGAAQECCE